MTMTAEEKTLPEATNSKQLSWVGVHVYADNGTEDNFEISGREDNMSVINVTSMLLQSNSGIYKTLQQLNDENAMARLPTIVYLSVLMVLGILGNLIVIIVYTFRYSKSNYRTFILCLSVIDIMSCCIYIPVEIVDNRYPYMFYSENACKICLFIGKTLTTGSAFILLVIAIDRFRKINSPLGVQLSYSAAKLSCGIAFGLAIVFSWPNAFIYGQKIKRFDGNITGYACSTDDDIRKSDYPFIYTVLLLGVFLVIFIVLASVYALIVYKIKMSTKFNREYLERINKRSRLKVKNRKVTKIMFAITLTFILSYMPFFTLKVISTFKKGLVAPPSPLVLGLFPIMSKSFFITSAVNPFIYAIGDRRFRKNLRSIVRSKLRCFKLCRCMEMDHLHSSGMEMFTSQVESYES